MRRYRIPVRIRFVFGLLTSCLFVIVLLQRATEAFAQQAAGRDPANATATNVPDGFTVAAVGDIIEAHPCNGLSGEQAHRSDIPLCGCLGRQL